MSPDRSYPSLVASNSNQLRLRQTDLARQPSRQTSACAGAEAPFTNPGKQRARHRRLQHRRLQHLRRSSCCLRPHRRHLHSHRRSGALHAAGSKAAGGESSWLRASPKAATARRTHHENGDPAPHLTHMLHESHLNSHHHSVVVPHPLTANLLNRVAGLTRQKTLRPRCSPA